MSDQNNSSTSIFAWKGVWIAALLAALFLGLLYLAMSNEPDYMPSNQAGNKHAQHGSSHSEQHAEPTAAEMNMSSAEHAAHQQQAANSTHSH